MVIIFLLNSFTFKTMTFSAMIFAVISAIINVVHVASLAVECGQQTSTFYLQGFPYLVVMLTGFVVFVLWQLWIAARLYVYRVTVTMAIERGWTPVAEYQQVTSGKNGYTQLPSSQQQQSNSAIGQQYGSSQIGANIPLLFTSPKHGQKHE